MFYRNTKFHLGVLYLDEIVSKNVKFSDKNVSEFLTNGLVILSWNYVPYLLY